MPDDEKAHARMNTTSRYAMGQLASFFNGRKSMSNAIEKVFIERGFVELGDDSKGSPHAASTGCSGGRSDCCTRVCSADQNYVSSAEAWEQFLDIQGGEVQY